MSTALPRGDLSKIGLQPARIKREKLSKTKHSSIDGGHRPRAPRQATMAAVPLQALA
ncbi:hypothetical protein ACFOHU_03050 [Ottowia pentelensis]|uniref:Uncharacterized protein n=1 Tax=Ottowia pentelensis TaxID=511108 RepID=A0ABV6PPE4_9BURK